MSRITVGMLIIGVAVLAAAPARAQLASLVGPDRVTLLYDGDLETDSGGIEIAPWGSGSAESVYEETYVGPHVLKVTTHGPYQGIVLKLGNPAELGEFLTSGAGYVDLRLKPAQAPRHVRKWQRAMEQAQAAASAGRAGRGGAGGRGGGGGGTRGGGGRGMGGGGGGARGMGGRGGGGGGMGMGGGGGGMGARGGGGMGARGGGGMGARGGGAAGARGGTTAGRGARGGQTGAGARAPTAAEIASKELTARHLRVVLFTDQGVMVADEAPVGVMPLDDRGWTPVTVSLSRFKGVEDPQVVRAVGIFTDESDVFYLGQVSLLVDRTPVQITVGADPLVARTNQAIVLDVSLRGGPINPRVVWDFDKTDGIQQQAVGSVVKYLYEEPGDYLVTCTVSDRDGVRSPVTKGVGIKVEGPA